MSTITSTVILETFVGNESIETPYPLAIQRDRNEDLFLLVDNVPTSDFSVSPDGIRTGTRISSDSILTVFRFTPRTQENPFPPNNSPSPTEIRSGLNKLTLMVQELSASNFSAELFVAPYRVQEITEDITLQPKDSNVFFRVNTTDPVVVTLPKTLGFDQSFSCEFSRVNTGSVRFEGASGVVVDATKFRIFDKFTSVAVRAVGFNQWQIYGDLY